MEELNNPDGRHLVETMNIRPSRSYASKLMVISTIVAVLTALVGYLFGQLIGIDEGPRVAMIFFLVTLALSCAYWIPAMILSWAYHKSLSYEIQDDEVIVRVGIWTKSVKHVPFRTVTNITIKRGILDRTLFDIGTLNIQTAGMSGTQGAEQSLVGLADVQEIYDIVANRLRLFRGAMGPAGAEVEKPEDLPADLMRKMLDELHEIRKNTEKQ
jgi:uncharacterized membrane protein YdbT with pleckstrin-like domain